MPKQKAGLPEWKNDPLKFTFSPDDALRQAMTVKPPKDWKKAIRASRKSRR